VIVADANVLVYRYVRGPFSSLADAANVKDADWRVPLFWRCEFTSAVLKLVRAGALSEAAALEAIAGASTHLTGREMDVPQDRAMLAALRFGTSAYDAQYVALAEMLGVSCVTADQPLAQKAPAVCVLLDTFVR
jgi:predicted nucleic acid-binding protein